jgi:hypothetical protein
MAVSSRPWNVFAEAYGCLPLSNTIVMQDLTRGDMVTYVEGQLLANEHFQRLPEQDLARAKLMDDIIAKSNGVFLWVFLIVRSLLRGLTNGDDLDILRQRVAEYPDTLNGYFQRMLNSTEKVYSIQMARILLAAVHKYGSLPLRLVEDFKTEMKEPDYDIWLRVSHLTPTREQKKYEILRVKKLLDARCRDLLEVVGSGIDFLHRTVKDFLTTRDIYSMLVDQAGPNFDPDVSLSRATLAVIKSVPCPARSDLSNLLLYEQSTASKNWPFDPEFLGTLGALIAIGSEYKVVRSTCTEAGVFLAYPGSVEDARAFLDVDESEDCLISVKQDLSMTIGDRGHSHVSSDHHILDHSWIGFNSAGVLDRIILIHARDTKAASRGVSDHGAYYVLVARFRDAVSSLDERQRAFIRTAQALFCRERHYNFSNLDLFYALDLSPPPSANLEAANTYLESSLAEAPH